MSPALVQQVAANDTEAAGATTLVLTVTATATTAGNVVICWVRVPGPSGSLTSVADSKGNTWHIDVGGTSSAQNSFIASAVMSAPLVSGDTITLTVGGAVIVQAAAAEFSGVAVSGGLAVVDQAANLHAAAATVTVATAANSAGGDLVVSAGAANVKTTTPTLTSTSDSDSGGTWTDLAQPGGGGLDGAYQIAPAGASLYSCGWSTGGTASDGSIVAYQAAAAGGGPTPGSDAGHGTDGSPAITAHLSDTDTAHAADGGEGGTGGGGTSSKSDADTAVAAESSGSVHATLSSSDTSKATQAQQVIQPGVGVIGSSLGSGSYTPGLPGGAGSPGGPAAPNQGAGWEVKVRAAPDFGTLLAVIPNSMLLTLQFSKVLKDLGAGTVTLSMDDPFWASVTLPNGQPAHYLLDWEHLWQVYQDGVLRFEFLGETVTEQLTDGSEQRIATVTGPGSAATLKWAMCAPPGFPDSIRYKLDALTDSFSEVDGNGNLALDTGLWNAATPASHLSLNPSGTARLMASPSVTYLGTTAYDGTNTLVSAQVNPIVSPDPAGNSLDGSQVTQMYVQSQANPGYYALMGMSGTSFYCQLGGPAGVFSHTIASATAFAAAQQGNNDYAYWQIAETGGAGGGSGTFSFYTSPDGQNWTKQWSLAHNWDATSVGLYFTAKYGTDNKEYATVTGLNSNVTTSSLGGPSYYGKHIIGGVWLDLLAQAQARGTVPFITTGRLGASTDSFGNPWTDSQSVQIANGTDLFTLLGAHASMINADWIMQPGFLLQVGIPETGKITLGTDRSSTVVFRDGMDCTARTRTRKRDAIANLYGVINSDGRTITASDGTSVTEYGQRESWLQAAMQVTTADLEAVATAADLQTADEVLSWTLQVTPWMPGRDIFNSFDVGDWVGLERPDFSAIDDVRVIGIAVQVTADGTETHELTLSSYIQWLDEQLTYIQNKLGGGLVNVTGTTAIPDSATSQNTPTVFSLTLGSLGDVQGGPAGNAPLVYDPVTGQWVPAGSDNGITGGVPLSVSGSGGTVTIDPGGGSVSVSAPTTIPGDGQAVAPVPVTQTTPTGTTVADATGTVRIITGQQQDGTVTTVDVNAPAPGIPDTPTAGAIPGGLIAGWDGLLGGAVPLSDFLWVEVHVSSASGFTPSSATLEATMAAGGTVTVTSLTPGTPYYVKLVAYNTSRAASAPSSQVSATPLASGGSGNKVSAQATAPASPSLNDLWINTSNSNELEVWNGTAWVPYQLGTGAINFTAHAIGGLSVTISSAAPTSPAPNTGDLWYDATNNYLLNQWTGSAWTPYKFGTNAIAAGSITAALIAANTITAAQIAAGAITANTLAIGAVTGGAPWSFTVAGNGTTSYFVSGQSQGSGIKVGDTFTWSGQAGQTFTVSSIELPFAGFINVHFTPASSAAMSTGTVTQSGTPSSNLAPGTITAAQIQAATITGTLIAAGTITGTNIQAGTITASLLQSGIIVAGIINGTVVTGPTIQNSSANPRTSINPDGSITITNSAGTVIFEVGPDGTMSWFTSAAALLMELQPGGTTLIYQSAVGPQSWDFEGSTQSWAGVGGGSVLTDDTTTWSSTGADSLKVASGGADNPWGARSPSFPAVPSVVRSAQCVIYTPTAMSSISIGFSWHDANGTFISTSQGDQGNIATNAGDVTVMTITGASAPSNAATAWFFVRQNTLSAAGTAFYVDAVQVAGGLAYSLSPTAGTDSAGNPYDEGLQFTGLAGLTNVFGVQDMYGNTVAKIDGSGNISGQTLSGAVDVLVGGQSVSSLLENPAFGLINYGYQAVGSTAWPSTAVGTTETALFELDQSVAGGRVYEFVWAPTIINVSAGTNVAHFKLRYTTDGSTPTTSSTEATAIGVQVANANSDMAVPGFRVPVFPTADGTYKFLVTGWVNSGTFQFKDDDFLRCMIYDMGSTAGVSANNLIPLGTGGSGGSGGGPQTYTEYFYPANTYSYYSGSGQRNHNGSMYHGAYSGESDYQFAYIQWAAGSRGNNLNTVLNYSVSKVSLRLTNLHSWYDNGMTWGLHSSTTLGGGVGVYSNILTSAFISEGNTFDYVLGTSMWAPFKAAGTTYLVLGPDAGDEQNLSWYGYFYGKGSDTGSMPRLTVVYTH